MLFPSEKESIRFVRLCRKEKVAGAEVVRIRVL